MRKLVSLMIVCCGIPVNTYAIIIPFEAREFDEFGNICCDDEKARLDNFFIEVQNNPEMQWYIIFYGGRCHSYSYCHSSRLRIPRRRESEARAARLKPYLVDTRGLESKRVVVVNGGYRELLMAELWIVPKGAKPPTPTPTVQGEDMKFRKGKPIKREYLCME